MAVKNSSFGVFNQAFHCFQYGRNSVYIGNDDLDSYDSKSELKSPKSIEKLNLDYNIGSVLATCRNCGWVEV